MHFEHGWLPISRELINDSRLQFDTRAVANWLMARPRGWQIRIGVLPYLLQQRAGPGERMGRDRVRRILRELERAGYLKRTRFKLPNGRWFWRVDFHGEPNLTQGREDLATMDGSAVDGSAVDGSPVDGQGVDLLNTLNNSRVDYSIPTTTTAAGDEDSEAVVVAPTMAIQYPKILQGDFLDAARKLIERCIPEQRQPILDEIGAMHAKGRVRSPLRLLKSLVDKAGSGHFFPNHSLSDPRSTVQGGSGAGVRQPPTDAVATPKSLVPVSEIGRQTLSRLREKLKPDAI